MICYIEGEVIAIGDSFVTIKTNAGIGYEVFCTASLTRSLLIGEFVRLNTSFIVKEDAQYLYGFTTLEELTWFKNLLKVSGVGAKTALAVLNAISIDDIIFAIQSKNEALFASVSGLGKKTASRLVADMEKDPYKTSVILSSLVVSDSIVKTQSKNGNIGNILVNDNDNKKEATKKKPKKVNEQQNEIGNKDNSVQRTQNKNLINDATLALEALGYTKIDSFTKVSLIVKNNPEIKLDELIKTCLKKD